MSLWSFLPDCTALVAAGVAEQGVAEPEQAACLCRSAVASTLVAGLELARQGRLSLGQEASGTFSCVDPDGAGCRGAC